LTNRKRNQKTEEKQKASTPHQRRAVFKKSREKLGGAGRKSIKTPCAETDREDTPCSRKKGTF